SLSKSRPTGFRELQRQLAVDFSGGFESAQGDRFVCLGCEFVALAHIADRFFDLINKTACRLGATAWRALPAIVDGARRLKYSFPALSRARTPSPSRDPAPLLDWKLPLEIPSLAIHRRLLRDHHAIAHNLQPIERQAGDRARFHAQPLGGLDQRARLP